MTFKIGNVYVELGLPIPQSSGLGLPLPQLYELGIQITLIKSWGLENPTFLDNALHVGLKHETQPTILPFLYTELMMNILKVEYIFTYWSCKMVEVKVDYVSIDEHSSTPVIILKQIQGNPIRRLMI